jgi:hypothetical protein
MKYKISTDIPLPPRGVFSAPRRKSRKLSIVQTLRALPLNGSFLVPLKGRKPEQVRGYVCGAIHACRISDPYMKFATRHIYPEKGIRIWRIQ